MSGRPKNKIDNLFQDYEDLLGEKLDNIVPVSNDDAFADDPEMKQLQKLIQQQQNKLPAKVEANQQYDVDLESYEKQMRGETNVVQPAKQQNNFVQVFLQQEKQYTNPLEFQSLSLIQHEVKIIQTENLQQPQVKNSKELMALYSDILNQLKQTQKNNLLSIDQNKFNAQSYLKLVENSLQAQLRHFSDAKEQNVKMFMSRIQKRLQVLETEKKSIQNDEGELLRIVARIKQQQSKYLQYVFGVNRLRLCNKSRLRSGSPSTVMQSHHDQEPREEKFISLLKIHKKNHNLTTYLMTHFKEERAQDIQQLVSSLEKGKACREEFLAGGNPQIGKLLMYDLTEVTFERFHRINQIEYQSRMAVMIEQITKALRDEEGLLTLQQKLNEKAVTTGSETLISQYNQLLKYLQSNENKKWVPLPILQKKEEIRLTVPDNRDVPANTLRIKFKRLMNVEENKYYITFSIEVNGTIVSQTTDICQKGSVFNYIKDIPLQHDRKTSSTDLHTKFIEIRVMEKGFFSDKTQGQATISLNNLEENHTIESSVSISTKHPSSSLEYGIYLREPTSKGKKKVDVYKLMKIYPEFVVDEGVSEFVSKMMDLFRAAPNQDKAKIQPKMVEEPMLIQVKQVPQKEEIKKEEPKMDEEEKPIKLIMLIHMDIDPEYSSIIKYTQANKLPDGITNEDVLFPENPNKAMVFNFVEPYGNFLSQKLIEVRQDSSMRPQSKFLQNTYDEYLRCISKIQKKLEAQDYDWYKNQITPSLQRDKKLKDVYTKAKAPTWVEFIQVRIDVTEQEIRELENL